MLADLEPDDGGVAEVEVGVRPAVAGRVEADGPQRRGVERQVVPEIKRAPGQVLMNDDPQNRPPVQPLALERLPRGPDGPLTLRLRADDGVAGVSGGEARALGPA